jgi:hypothetical protein
MSEAEDWAVIVRAKNQEIQKWQQQALELSNLVTPLRDENARLRGAIETFNSALPKYTKKSLHGLKGEYWSPAGMMVDTELIATLVAALTPQAGKESR